MVVGGAFVDPKKWEDKMEVIINEMENNLWEIKWK